MISGACGPNSSDLIDKASHDNYLLKEGHSSKMDALIKDVREDIETTKRQVAGQNFSSSPPLSSFIVLPVSDCS